MKKLLIPVLLVALLGCAGQTEQEKKAREWNNKGSALGELGQDEEALKAFEKAIELDPDYAEAWHNKSAALIQLGRYEEASKSLKKAKELRSRKIGMKDLRGP